MKVCTAPTLQIRIDLRTVNMPRKSFYKMDEEVVDGFPKHNVIPQFENMRVNEEKKLQFRHLLTYRHC